MSEREQLEQAIAHLEGQRSALGDGAVDAALAGLCQKLAASEDIDGPPEPVAPELVGERKRVTIMFADISGFTSLAERMDPEAVRNLVNACFDHLVPIIEKYGGTVTKFIGDAIESVFGAPIAHENDPERALRCALEVMDAIKEFSATRDIDLGLHIGVNTGLVVAGGIGSSGQRDYAVTGDAINLAARLEDASQRGEILVGPDTYHLTASTFAFEILEPIKVHGKRDPVQVYRLVGLKDEPERGRWLASAGISSPLVGREAESEAVRSCVARLMNGEGGLLWLIGEAGLGKSRLMAEVRKQVLADEAGPALSLPHLRWLEGRALSFGETISYWPFQGILRQWAGITEEDSEGEAWDKLERAVWGLFTEDTAEVLPYLASLLSLEVKGPYAERVKYLDGEAMGRQVYLTARRFTERLAREQPLVLVFEDLHWVDQSSVELLEHLLLLVERVPLLICGVSRPLPDTAAAHLREVAARDHANCYMEVRLVPLSGTESEQLIDNLLQIEALSSQVRETIVGKAEGNPFFVEEIVRALIDTGAVVRDRTTGRWRATVGVEILSIPDTIQGVIMSRVDRLDEDVKEVLRTAAVIGRSFFYRVLRAIAEADRELDGHLAELQAVELIREKQAAPELEYIFKHALAQEATYQSILLEKRRDLHARVGSAIETLFAGRLEEFYGLLAYHYARAEAWEKAQDYLLKAGDQAGRVAADAEALTHYRQAMAMYEQVYGDRWDPMQRAALERKMGDAFLRQGDPQQATDHLERALACLGRPLPASRWGTRWAVVRQITRQIGHRLLPGLFLKPPGGSISMEVSEQYSILHSMNWINLFADRERLLLSVLIMLNLSERAGHLPGVAMATGALGSFLDIIPIFWLAEGYHRRALALAERVQDPGELGFTHYCLAFHECIQGKLDAALEHGRLALEAFWEAGDLHGWGRGASMVARTLTQQGNLAEALAYSDELIRVAQDGGDTLVLSWGVGDQGRAQMWRGRWEEARSALKKSCELADVVPDVHAGVECRAILGQLYVYQGELERALATLQEAQRLSAESAVGWQDPAPLRNGLAEAYLLASERSEETERPAWLKKAGRACRVALKYSKAFRRGLPEAMRLQGTHDWLRDKPAAARKWWGRSIDLAEAMGQRYNLGMSHLEMGRRLGDRTHLERAEAIFAEIGAEWDLVQARKALEKAG